MDSNEVALIISAVAASLASIIYSFKHVRKSQCCGNTCEQVIVDATKTPRTRNLSDAVILAPVPEHRTSPPLPEPVPAPPSIFSFFGKQPAQSTAV
jgi:hypothetical protein